MSEATRGRRKREVRAVTVPTKRLNVRKELEAGAILFPLDEHVDVMRPKTRGDCVGGERPCPFAGCRYHLFLDVHPRTGSIKLNFPDLELEELAETCALDVADREGTTLEKVGAILNVTRERIRQIENKALATAERHDTSGTLREYVDEGPIRKRRLPVVVDQGGASDDE